MEKRDKESGLIQEPFRLYNIDNQKKADTFTVKLNPKERLEFDENKKILQQDKDSTAMKQLASIGAKVLLDKKMIEILEIVMNNFRKNKRLNIIKFDK